MSLVAYGSSDESEEDNSQDETSTVIKKSANAVNCTNNVINKTIAVKATNSKQNSVSLNNRVRTVNSVVENDKKHVNKVENRSVVGVADTISDEEDNVEISRSKNKDNEKQESQNFLSLPAPKTKLHDIDFDWSRLSKGATQPVKISVPSLAELDTEEPSEPIKKKLKPSKKGSGLFALLPSPKNSFINPIKTTLKPQQLQNKPQFKPEIKNKIHPKVSSNIKNKLPLSVNYDDSPDEEDDGGNDKKIDFFSLTSSPADEIQTPDIDLNILSKPEELLSVQPQTQSKWQNLVSSSRTETLPHASMVGPSSASTTVQNESDLVSVGPSAEYIPLDQEDIALDETALQQLCGRRERQQGKGGLQIIDVSGDAILPDAREWLTKQLTEEQNVPSQSHKKKDGPTTQQRRKHQITYLAFQAKEHELELKNQWANNRMSRKQTQAKYGF